MRRSRQPAAPPAAALQLLLQGGLDTAIERLRGDTLAFVTDTAEEDPKRYVARMAAAREALETLRLLCALAAPAAEPPPEPSNDDVLEAARAGMASERLDGDRT